MKELKVKVRKAYKTRKLGKQFQVVLEQLSRQLLAAKKNAQETYYCPYYKKR
jgi:hypothetical protein